MTETGVPEEHGPGRPWSAGDVVDGRYRLIAPEGHGAFGEVWQARDVRLEIPVAIKILAPELAAVPEFRRRFEREARATAALHGEHHVVQIYDYHPEFPVYLVMRHVPGRNLSDLVAGTGSGLDPARSVGIVLQIAEALMHAHSNGLVHRDVKPTNVLVDRNTDVVHLADFGIVAAIDDEVLTKLTARGAGGIGTTRYMSPERIEDPDADTGRSSLRSTPAVSMDVYGLTCLLYECLTGQYAFPQRNRDAVERAHREGRRPRPSDVIESLAPFDGVTVRGLAIDPGLRTRTVEVFADELRDALRVWARYAGQEVHIPMARVAEEPRIEPGIGSEPEPEFAVEEPQAESFAEGPSLEESCSAQLPVDLDGLDPPTSRLPLRVASLAVRPDFRVDTGPLRHGSALPFLCHQHVVDRLRALLQSSSGGALLLTGANGAGKTTVVTRALRELRDDLRRTGSEPDPLVEVWHPVARPVTPDVFLMQLVRNLTEALDRARVLDRIPTDIRSALRTSYDRTSLRLSVSESNAWERNSTLEITALGSAKMTGGAKRTRSTTRGREFLDYTLADAEHDLIRVLSAVDRVVEKAALGRRSGLFGRRPRAWTGRIVVVIDELDKLTADEGGRECLHDLVRSLKNILSASRAHFLFVAATDLPEVIRSARGRGDSTWESVFGRHVALPRLDLSAAATLLRAILVDQAPGGVINELADFLTFRSRGLPRLLINELVDLIDWAHGGGPRLVVDNSSAQSVAFYAHLNQRLGPMWARLGDRAPLDDQMDVERRRAAVHLVVERALNRKGGTFTVDDFYDRCAAPGGAVGESAATETADFMIEMLDELVAMTVIERNGSESPDRTMLGSEIPSRTVYRLAQDIVELGAQSTTVGPRELGRVGGGRYVLLEELSHGVFGRTYRALDRHTERTVAIKSLDPAGLHDDVRARRRFQREGELMSRLDHPCLAAVQETIEDDGSLVIVTEYITGRNLAALIAVSPLPPEQAVTIASDIAELLDYLDQAGIVRLHLKPSNVVLRDDDRPVVVGTGLARDRSAEGSRLTAPGAVVGTPRYLAPEQLVGEEPDVRSAIYSLGLLLLEMLTMRKAHPDLPPRAKHQGARSRADVDVLTCSSQLRDLIVMMTEPDRARRPGDAAEAQRMIRATPEYGAQRPDTSS